MKLIDRSPDALDYDLVAAEDELEPITRRLTPSTEHNASLTNLIVLSAASNILLEIDYAGEDVVVQVVKGHHRCVHEQQCDGD